MCFGVLNGNTSRRRCWLCGGGEIKIKIKVEAGGDGKVAGDVRSSRLRMGEEGSFLSWSSLACSPVPWSVRHGAGVGLARPTPLTQWLAGWLAKYLPAQR